MWLFVLFFVSVPPAQGKRAAAGIKSGSFEGFLDTPGLQQTAGQHVGGGPRESPRVQAQCDSCYGGAGRRRGASFCTGDDADRSTGREGFE